MLFSEEDAFNGFFIDQAKREGAEIEVSPLQIRTDSDIDFVLNRRLYAIRPYQHASRTTRGDSVRILPIRTAEGREIAIPLHLFWKKGRGLGELEGVFVDMIAQLYRCEVNR